MRGVVRTAASSDVIPGLVAGIHGAAGSLDDHLAQADAGSLLNPGSRA
jgi:hypothetical protein